MKGAATWAALIRSSKDTLGFLMMPNKNSSGEISGFAAAAASAAFLSAVFLFDVPRWRPPRLSPGFDPLGIAISLFYFCLIGGLRGQSRPRSAHQNRVPSSHRYHQ
jgi:hypothetical protein